MKHPRVRVRFAPSPTGFLHIGGLRTALYNELLARQQGGDFILRIEDTDQARRVEGAIENICASLQTCGIIPNEGVWMNEQGKITQKGTYGPYIQSERKEKHLAYAADLIKMGKAYYCFCPPKRLEELRAEQQLMHTPTMYDGLCRDIPLPEAQKRVIAGEQHVIRLNVPKTGNVSFIDAIRGEITVDWTQVDDQVLIKSDGYPTYHLAATCDDHDMAISHVIRGEEWISSTPKHVFIYEAFGWTAPTFAHLPLLLNSDRSKLSKRQGDVATSDYLEKGYLPEALINFVALLGWNPSADQEVYSHNDLVTHFDLAKINKAGAVFNLEKLDWLNAQYLREMPEQRYFDLALPFIEGSTADRAFAERCARLVRDRVQRPLDVTSLTSYFFQKSFNAQDASITWKQQSAAEAVERLSAVRETLSRSEESVFGTPVSLEQTIKALIADKGWGNGDTLWPLRVALSGQEKSPSPFELLWAYGKERSLSRIDAALKTLSGDSRNPFAAVVALFLVGVSLCFSGGLPVHAADTSDGSDTVKEQVDSINTEIKKNRDRVNELQGVIKKYRDRIQEQESKQVTLENEIAILENRVIQKQLGIEQIKAQLEATRLEILSLDTQIERHTMRIATQKDEAAELIRRIDQSDTVSVVEVLLTHPSLSTFFDRIEEDKSVERELSTTLTAVKDAKSALETAKKDQNTKRLSLETDKKQLHKDELTLEAERSFKTSLIETTKNAQGEFERVLYELQQQQQSTSDDIAMLEDKLKDKLDVVDAALARGDILLNWPVNPTKGVSAHFHDPTYPFKNLFQHPGTDIPTNVGTVVKAAAGGYVAWHKQGRLYGNYMMVVHPGNIATVYAHLSKFIAKPDTYIERGDPIALSGGRPGDPGAGLSTGPHLHFEVRQNGIPVNAENFLPTLDEE